eukprot:15360-Heterococcus_DN1.PRE.1
MKALVNARSGIILQLYICLQHATRACKPRYSRDCESKHAVFQQLLLIFATICCGLQAIPVELCLVLSLSLVEGLDVRGRHDRAILRSGDPFFVKPHCSSAQAARVKVVAAGSQRKRLYVKSGESFFSGGSLATAVIIMRAQGVWVLIVRHCVDPEQKQLVTLTL